MISYFRSLPEKGKPHKSDEQITINDFLNGIKYGKWKDQIEPIRAIPDKKKRNELKRNIPSVTISGVFNERKEDNLIAHSGFIQIDIDVHVDRDKLESDPYSYAVFSSASGVGICIIVKINSEKHKDSFRWLSNYYFSTYGFVVDSAPQNVASLRFVSFDPMLYVNEKAKKSGTKAEPKRINRSLPIVLPSSIAGDLCQQVNQRGIDIAPNYDDYMRLCFAMASGFGEEGRAMFHTLCQPSPKYDSSQADKKFDHCLNLSRNGKAKASVGTFYWMLKQNGIEPPRGNQKAVQIAAMGKRSGRTPEAILDQLVQVNGVSKEQAESLVKEVMTRNDIDLRSVTSDPENIIEGLMEFIRQNHPIRKNSITQKLEENGQEVSKERLNSIYLRARSVFNKKDVTYDLIERIIFSDFTNEFNPIKEYIDRNRYRNSSGHIKQLAATINTNTEGFEIFVRRWVIGWIAALDGYPVRSVLTLCGGQNTGKTEWFRRLSPSGLRKYYAESKLDAGKDDEILMCQKLWVMDDEMGGKSKQDEKRFKELTSKSTFSLRAPYGRHNEDYKRLAVLCGTSNDESVLNDPTGNTRILPVRVISINHDAYNAIDKDELFMEAVRAYESGESWELNKEEMSLLQTLNTEFETTPYERELILKFFAKPKAGEYSQFKTSTDIKDYIETNTRQKIMSLRKLGIECRNLFGEPISRRIDGSPLKGYEVILLRGNDGETHSDSTTYEDEPF